MKSVSVSVVMSVFNGETFLAEAIDSILSQTFRDFEFVIIDDGSTDGTPAMLADYESKDERVRIFRHENKGRALSLNVGINLARGKYIARMDSDDVALPNRLAEQVSFLEVHPKVGLLGGAFELISSDGRVLSSVRFPTKDTEIRSAMLVDNPICHPAAMMKKETAQQAGGYRKALVDADDYDLWLRIIERSEVANLETCVLQYRVHPAQVSIKNMRHQKMCVLAARAAAAHRKRALADPLANVERITPEFLETLGVSKAEIEENVLGGYRYWCNLLERNYPEAALGALNGILELHESGTVGRREAADSWMKAAGIHYRRGRPMTAMFCAGRGFLTRPIMAGRPLKRALMKFTHAIKNES